MKKKVIAIAVFAIIILTSCVVKSLKPFYTKDTLAYDVSLLGKWEDNKLRVWEVVPMMKYLDSATIKKEIDGDNKVTKGKKLKKIIKEVEKNKAKIYGNAGITLFSEMDNLAHPDSVKVEGKITFSKNKNFFENKELQEIYKNAYLFIEKKELSKEDAFFAKKKEECKGAYVVVPFQIKGQVFLDFTPFDDEFSNDFESMHHIGIHTLAKLDKEGKDFKLSWLSEDVVQELFKQKKIRIKHEKIGLEQKDVLLTASSEELQKFIAKYIDLEQKGKWEGKTLTLKRIK